MSDNSEPLEMNNSRVRPPFNVSLWLQGALLAGLFLIVFGATIPALYHDWRAFDTFSHGLLVPLISAYLVWQKRTKLMSLPIRSSAWGLAVIFPAVLLAIVGAAVGESFTERVGMVLCFAGLIWTLFGTAVFKHVGFPLAFLFLMIPLPYVAVKEVAYHLRIIDAAIAAPALRLLGVPVYRETYYLHLPDITLEVADLCSGISSVFALYTLGAAYVYMLPLPLKWKSVAVLSTFPFAAFINLVRIILTAALAYYVSTDVLNVLVHKLTGTITFFIALVLFILLVEFLQRRFVRPGHTSAMEPPANPPAQTTKPERSWITFGAAVALMALAVFFTFNLKAQANVVLPASLAGVPLRIGAFEASNDKVDGFYKDPSAEQELARRYVAPSGETVETYVAYRGRQQADERLRSPKLQFPYGWNYVWIKPDFLSSRGDGTLNANWMLTQNNQVQVLVLYWYQARGETVAGETQNRLAQLRRALFERRTDGAVVRLATPVAGAEGMDQARKLLASFASELYPELRRAMPQ